MKSIFQHVLHPRQLARTSGWLSLGFAVALLARPRQCATLLGLRRYPMVIYALGLRDLALAWGLLTRPHLVTWQALRAVADGADAALLVLGAVHDPSARKRGSISAIAACAWGLVGWWNAFRLKRDVLTSS